MWVGDSILKKKLRYTEIKLDKNGTNFAKSLISATILAPVRMVNELSVKLTLVDNLLTQSIFVKCVIFDAAFLLLYYFRFGTSIMLLAPSLAAIVHFIIYLKMQEIGEYNIPIIDIDDVDTFEGVDAQKYLDLDEGETKAEKETVDMTKAEIMEVKFNEATSLFIKDPAELTTAGISPGTYIAAETERMINGISMKSQKTISKKTLENSKTRYSKIPDETVIGNQLDNAFDVDIFDDIDADFAIDDDDDDL